MNEQAIAKRIADDGSSVTLVLSGAFSIENVSELHAACVESLAEFPAVALDASGLESVDMTVIQVICSVCKTAAANNISLTLEGQVPDCVITLAAAFGAQVGAICHQNKNAACAWFGGME